MNRRPRATPQQIQRSKDRLRRKARAPVMERLLGNQGDTDLWRGKDEKVRQRLDSRAVTITGQQGRKRLKELELLVEIGSASPHDVRELARLRSVTACNKT